jgi:MFS family permease
MMSRGVGMMGSMNFGMLFGGMAILGLASGVIVLVSAILLRSRPKDYTTWRVLILIFSILSFLSMGGFLVGAILGLVGGALTLSWRPSNAA